MRKMNWRIWKNIKLPRGKFLKRLDWYIIKKFLGTYVFAIALIISIAVVFDFNEKMDRFMSHEAPWNAIVFDYYLNFIPYFANLFSPLFVFIAVIFQTGGELGNYCHVLYGNEFQAYVAPLYGICGNHCGSDVLPRVLCHSQRQCDTYQF